MLHSTGQSLGFGLCCLASFTALYSAVTQWWRDLLEQDEALTLTWREEHVDCETPNLRL